MDRHRLEHVSSASPPRAPVNCRRPEIPRGAAAVALAGMLAVGGASACDPAPGSEIACTPTPVPAGAVVMDDVAPTEPAAMQAWLIAGTYAQYLPESAAHASAGPHDLVRTFINRRLADSLATCEASHPIGATAVKELRAADALRGWAVMVKTRAEPGAASWYWYEVFDTSAGAPPAVTGQGHGTCTGCHDAGLDAVRTRWPLR